MNLIPLLYSPTVQQGRKPSWVYLNWFLQFMAMDQEKYILLILTGRDRTCWSQQRHTLVELCSDLPWRRNTPTSIFECFDGSSSTHVVERLGFHKVLDLLACNGAGSGNI